MTARSRWRAIQILSSMKQRQNEFGKAFGSPKCLDCGPYAIIQFVCTSFSVTPQARVYHSCIEKLSIQLRMYHDVSLAPNKHILHGKNLMFNARCYTFPRSQLGTKLWFHLVNLPNYVSQPTSTGDHRISRAVTQK